MLWILIANRTIGVRYKMRKSTKAIAAGVLAAVVGTGVALADIEFSASNNNQISNPGTGNPIMNETGQDYLIEILWSAGDPSGSAPGIGGGAGAGEYLLTSATNGGYSGPNGAYSGYYGLAYGLFGTANYGDGSVGGADVNSGYVYSRICRPKWLVLPFRNLVLLAEHRPCPRILIWIMARVPWIPK